MKRTDNATTNSEYLSNGIADIIVKIQKEEIPLETVKVLSSIAERISKVMILKIESENVHNTNSKTIKQDLVDRQKALLGIFDKLNNNKINMKTAKALSKKAMEQIRNVEKQIKGK